MQDFEKLGAFYLGKTFDQAAGQRTDNPCSTMPRI
jgi:hypothetical protein